MIKKYFLFLAVFLCVAGNTADLLAKSKYIFRQRLNWVKIIKADPKDVPLGTLSHPYRSVTVDEMEAMLLSIKVSKRYVLKKEIKTADVFNSWEARKFAPHLVEALRKVDADQVVHFSVIHKRPIFILRADYLTMGNLWVSTDGVHFQFTKLFAKMVGDYQASANMDKAVRKAKTRRLSLEAGDGQKLSYESTTEIIMDPNYDFINQVAREQEEQRLADEEFLLGKKKGKKKTRKSKQARLSGTSEVATSGDITARLKRLENLKKEKLITQKEYQELRKKILSDI